MERCMQTIVKINQDAAKWLPDSVFESPLEIASELGLTLGEKLGTLKRWAAQANARLAASTDGMPTNGTSGGDLELLELIGATIGTLETGGQSTPNPTGEV
jgi:hypothetical protein